MENNKRRGAGGITFLMLIVILFGALWFTNQIEQKERELSYSEFRSLVEEGGRKIQVWRKIKDVGRVAGHF